MKHMVDFTIPFPEETLENLLGMVKFNGRGLVPAIVQQHDSGEVLMLAWMNAEALRRTVVEKRTIFFSRSRREYWRKGDSSGHQQLVKKISIDCDGDALLVTVDQIGTACHRGTRTCFDDRRYCVDHIIS